MAAYILRRLVLMVPTLFGVMLVSFVIVQFAPGGPIEHGLFELGFLVCFCAHGGCHAILTIWRRSSSVSGRR